MNMTTSSAAQSSADKALEVLFAFSISRPRLSAAEVAKLAGMNRSTAHRMLQLLEAKHLVQRRTGDSSRYELTARILQLSEVVLHQLDDLRSAALSDLTSLRDSTGETAALHVHQNGGRVGITQVESYHHLRRTYADLGKRVPLYLGAPSLAMLAFLPQEQIERILPTSEAVWANVDGLDHARVLEILAKIRVDGYAVSHAHRLSGIVSIAAPIRSRFGGVIAAINVTGPEARFDDESVARMATEVVQAAARVSRHLGYEAEEQTSPARSTPRKA